MKKNRTPRTTKVCAICKRVKPLSAFYHHNGRPISYCYPCNAKYHATRLTQIKAEERPGILPPTPRRTGLVLNYDMRSALAEEEIDPLYKELWVVREEHGWSVETLQEALRQEWELFYQRRVVTPTTPPCLQDLRGQLDHEEQSALDKDV